MECEVKKEYDYDKRIWICIFIINIAGKNVHNPYGHRIAAGNDVCKNTTTKTYAFNFTLKLPHRT